MERNYDLCSGRDQRGHRHYTVVPSGVVRTGMYVRLVGGNFLLIDRVENRGKLGDDCCLCAAAEVLQPMWARGQQ